MLKISRPLVFMLALASSHLAIADTSAPTPVSAPASAPAQVPISIEAIDKVWSGHSVPFAMTTSKDHLYLAYYDANRQLTVAQRPLNAPSHWVYHKLDTWLGWDSHNLIAMALDASGAVHIAANMHVDPLTMFRSDASGDVRSLQRMSKMLDAAREKAMTYPVFLKNHQGQLIFKYRDGSSGRGNEIYTIYDEKSQSWKALTNSPLTDGEGQRNAYFMGPTRGSDGYFHVAWVWRESPSAETNHDLSYAKSRDLVHWERADGSALTLPIRLKQAEIVDPVPVGGGMINNNTVLGFDEAGRAIITYHKYDAAGNTQIWLARHEKAGWKLKQISAWTNYRWDFKGNGSLNSEIFVEGARPGKPGQLLVAVTRLGQRLEFTLDSRSLEPVTENPVSGVNEMFSAYLKTMPDMQINTTATTDSKGQIYRLAWTTQAPHRDLPLTEIVPATDLKLFVFNPAKP
ncbi:BNR-4 repeat-containing protein [Undibacterium sp. Ji50W]|uniref:BNR-4 repeat-containing protein n=1 Tax=Undibacterium sp. Ji50W TaxID=3413041 RepID=UPI003BF21400